MMVLASHNEYKAGDMGMGIHDVNREYHPDQPFIVLGRATLNDYHDCLREFGHPEPEKRGLGYSMFYFISTD